LVVARSGRPLEELDGLKAAAHHVAWRWTGGDGWQVVQLHRSPDGYDSQRLPADWERLLVSVMEQTGHPVLAAVVLDSDGAQLIGYSPNAGRWGGWLMLERIVAHLDYTALPGGRTSTASHRSTWARTTSVGSAKPWSGCTRSAHRVISRRPSRCGGRTKRASRPPSLRWGRC
jgi:hypothetical protein